MTQRIITVTPFGTRRLYTDEHGQPFYATYESRVLVPGRVSSRAKWAIYASFASVAAVAAAVLAARLGAVESIFEPSQRSKGSVIATFSKSRSQPLP